jgi:hypothetical protein
MPEMQLPFEKDSEDLQGKRVVLNGAPSNDLVLSAYADSNEEILPKTLLAV